MEDLVWSEGADASARPKAGRSALLLEALRRNPNAPALHVRHGTALREEGAMKEAIAAYRRALDLDPDHLDASLALASSLAETGRSEQAIERWRALELRGVDRFEVHAGLGRALSRSGRADEAVEPLRRALRQRPDDFHALRELARIRIGAGLLDEALSTCDESLARRPGNASALGVRSQVLQAMGRASDAAELLSFDRLLAVGELAPPPGYADLATFNAALTGSIHANPGLRYEPRGLATRRGTQGSLPVAGDRPEVALYGLVRRAIEDYRARVAGFTAHPFCAALPREARLLMWTVVLREGGHQTAHIHPGGWLSAVYYVAVPRVASARTGNLVVGCADPGLGVQDEPNARFIEPRPGVLVLFPAFYYHRTVPTTSAEERICVAFNMVVRPD